MPVPRQARLAGPESRAAPVGLHGPWEAGVGDLKGPGPSKPEGWSSVRHEYSVRTWTPCVWSSQGRAGSKHCEPPPGEASRSGTGSVHGGRARGSHAGTEHAQGIRVPETGNGGLLEYSFRSLPHENHPLQRLDLCPEAAPSGILCGPWVCLCELQDHSTKGPGCRCAW